MTIITLRGLGGTWAFMLMQLLKKDYNLSKNIRFQNILGNNIFVKNWLALQGPNIESSMK